MQGDTRAEPIERDPASLFAPPRVSVERRPDGSRILRSPDPLLEPARCVHEWLLDWAARAPDRVFLAERTERAGATADAGTPEGAPWRSVTYREALAQVMSAADWLLAEGLSPERPLVVLSDNGVDHALLGLAAMAVGIPYAPVSPAYSLMSSDHARLKAIIRLLSPGAIYVADPAPFESALAAIASLHDATQIRSAPIAPGTRGPGAGRAVRFAELLGRPASSAADAAQRAVGPDTVAKILFTSGSTGSADSVKGVLNTQRMLCASQQAKAQVWPFLATTPPVIVDWLPWNHTFGGNHNFNLVLRHGGTLHIDGGKPVPGLFDKTLANLRDVSPTLYFNVPRGFDLLIPALRQDAALRARFFERLQVLFYAAAALPQNAWDALRALSVETIGRPVAMVSAWGSTETSPLATDCHFQAPFSGVIGLPTPGTELKLVPNAGKLEIRVRGPNVMPGYAGAPELTRSAFDDEGFYRIGDAVRFVDEAEPARGLLFDGRVSEDFKLSTGTWVNVGMLRVRAIAALAPVAQDIVVCGHDRDWIGLLVFANLPACRAIAAADPQAPLPADAAATAVLAHPAVIDALRQGLARLKSAGGGAASASAAAALLMAEPPSIDAGEITDKGYINQRAVLVRRAGLVATLLDGGDGVVTLEGNPHADPDGDPAR